MAMGTPFDSSDEVMSEINMTPLVDVMLVLLIIFIITVPVLTHTVKVDLPDAANQKQDIKPETVMVSVDADGQTFWNDQLITIENLTDKLSTTAALQPQPEIHIRGDKNAKYEYVVSVMAAAQKSGIDKLGFVTEPN